MYQFGENGYIESANPLTWYVSPFNLWSLSLACCGFQYKSYAHILLDLNWTISLFWVIINSIDILVFMCLLLIYRNKIYFCTFILSTVTMLNSLINSRCVLFFFGRFLRIFLCRKLHNFQFLFLPFWSVSFNFLSCFIALAWASCTMLNKSDKSRYLSLLLILGVKNI